jgi:hypothetical protein
MNLYAKENPPFLLHHLSPQMPGGERTYELRAFPGASKTQGQSYTVSYLDRLMKP